jgi:hypothetical protein
MSDHGRLIPLSTLAIIQVLASYNTLDINLPTALFREVESFRKGVEDIEFSIDQLNPSIISDLPAFHYRTSIKKNGRAITREGFVAISKDKGIVYSIYLQTPETEFHKYEHYLSNIVGSWHASPRE